MNKLDEFFEMQEEPAKSCLIAMRAIVKSLNESIQEKWYYKVPCYFYKDKLCAYLYLDKKKQEPYIAIYPGKKLKHPALKQAGRTMSKEYRLNPNADIDVALVVEIFEEAFFHFDSD